MITLYKRDSKSKIRIWTICTIDDEIHQQSGLLDGKLVSNSKLAKCKNVGRSNETSGSEQAVLEMNSLIKSKLDEGYFKTKEEAENELVILPMLAKSYDDYKAKIDWANCFIQPKLDGMRCLAIIKGRQVTLMSRDGKVIENMQHIIDELSSKLYAENIVLDGELYAHGSSFQENMKLIKKYRKGETEKIKYHVYDYISTDSYNSRHSVICKNLINFETVELVDTVPCKSEDDLKVSHALNIENGYEGSIIRHGLVGYKIDGRSSNLLKYKDFQDITAEIIDILPNDANPLHGTPLLKYSNQKMSGKSESLFKAGVKMSHADREDLLKNKKDYIGKTAEVRFFEWTDDGNPRFPVMVGIRLDK